MDPSPTEVEGQQFFFSSDAVSSVARVESCLLLIPPVLLSLDQKLNYFLERLYKLQAKICGNAVGWVYES